MDLIKASQYVVRYECPSRIWWWPWLIQIAQCGNITQLTCLMWQNRWDKQERAFHLPAMLSQLWFDFMRTQWSLLPVCQCLSVMWFVFFFIFLFKESIVSAWALVENHGKDHCLGKNWAGRIWQQGRVRNVKIIGYYLQSDSAQLSVCNGCPTLYLLFGKGGL